LEFDGRFVMVVPGMVLRDTVALLEGRFLRGVAKFSKVRAETLDRLAVDYLTTLLPGSKGFTHLHYGDAELDGLVIFETTAFVVEGKGTALSVQAQRGDLLRLRRRFLQQRPNRRQSQRHTIRRHRYTQLLTTTDP
jgi:hypothetical protein